jgi:hypothetical protein
VNPDAFALGVEDEVGSSGKINQARSGRKLIPPVSKARYGIGRSFFLREHVITTKHRALSLKDASGRERNFYIDSDERIQHFEK